MKGWFLLLLFRLTPAKWICGGCNNCLYGFRSWWGCFITQKYGYYEKES